MVGTGKLPGTPGGGAPRDSLVWSRSMFSEAMGDGDAVSFTSDRVRQDYSHKTHNVLHFWNVSESIAIFTLAISVFGTQ